MQVDSLKIEERLLPLYAIKFRINEKNTTLPSSAYSIDLPTITLDKLPKDYKLYLHLKSDTVPDRDRDIQLAFDILKDGKTVPFNNSTNNLTLTLTVKGYKAVGSTNYLAFVGTNFDLVDGIKAKNLYFAVNLFAAPTTAKKDWGFNLMLYGNRTLTTTDTSSSERYTSRIIPLGGDSAMYFTEEALVTIDRVSDNLGASFSPLIKVWNLSSLERTSQIYYAPQFEFIWRRTKVTTTYSEQKVVDSLVRTNRPITTRIDKPDNTVIPINIYDVYLGLFGVLMNHEIDIEKVSSKHKGHPISIRVQASVGWNLSYTAARSGSSRGVNTAKIPYNKESNLFFFTRAMIMEPLSGVTFGAEVSNTFGKKNNAQPYYNVTLSKAFPLSGLSGIFQPTSSR